MFNNYKIIQIIIFSVLIVISTVSACSKDNDLDETIINETEDTISYPLEVSGFPIVDTNQSNYFNNLTTINKPSEKDEFYGQDAQYNGNQPSYTNNQDGTITDNVTGLMWQSTFDHNEDGIINYDDKLSYFEILEIIESGVSYAGYNNWRLPNIKEQYSLIMFSGEDISNYTGTETEGLNPFINTDYFEFNYGDLNAGERLIDMQCASTNMSVVNDEMVFGVNFADGRIKGYETVLNGSYKAFNYLLVRGNETYGENDFIDNGNGTITDNATSLMWMQNDSGTDGGMTWQEALKYAENYEYEDISDWRLPNAKELQSIVDYTRSPQTTNSAAIDPIFNSTKITNEAGEEDYPWYWSSTTHISYGDIIGGWACYISFGKSMGNYGSTVWEDVHGAGAQRSDPKNGNPNEYADGHGPQGDAVRIYNHVRLVRNIN